MVSISGITGEHGDKEKTEEQNGKGFTKSSI